MKFNGDKARQKAARLFSLSAIGLYIFALFAKSISYQQIGPGNDVVAYGYECFLWAFFLPGLIYVPGVFIPILFVNIGFFYLLFRNIFRLKTAVSLFDFYLVCSVLPTALAFTLWFATGLHIGFFVWIAAVSIVTIATMLRLVD